MCGCKVGCGFMELWMCTFQCMLLSQLGSSVSYRLVPLSLSFYSLSSSGTLCCSALQQTSLLHCCATGHCSSCVDQQTLEKFRKIFTVAHTGALLGCGALFTNLVS